LKGISPVVAVVILMALVVTLGIMVSIWTTGWFSTQRSAQEFGCASRSRYIIENAKYYLSETTLKFRITNKGDEGLYEFAVSLYNGTMTENMITTAGNITLSEAITSTNKLGREESVYMAVNLSGGRNMGPTLTQVRVKNGACESISAIIDYIDQKS